MSGLHHMIHGDTMTSEMAVIENIAWEIRKLNNTLKDAITLMQIQCDTLMAIANAINTEN